MQITITLPDTFAVESRGASVDVNLSGLSENVVTRLVLHGLGQKVGDAAASALADAGFGGRKFAELSDVEKNAVRMNAREAMGKVVTALEAGDWGIERVNGARASVDPIVAEMRAMFLGQYKKNWIAVNGKDGWKAVNRDEVNAEIDTLVNADPRLEAIKAAAAERIALRKAEQAQAEAFTLVMPK